MRYINFILPALIFTIFFFALFSFVSKTAYACDPGSYPNGNLSSCGYPDFSQNGVNYSWTQGGQSCSSNSDCAQYETQSCKSYCSSGNDTACFGYTNGSRCIELQAVDTNPSPTAPVGNPTATSAPTSVQCNSISLSTSPTSANSGSSVSLNIQGDGSTYPSDDYGGGLTNCQSWQFGSNSSGQYGQTTCSTSATPGTYTWTHSWKHCEGSFSNCSGTCTATTSFTIVGAAVATSTPVPNATSTPVPNATSTLAPAATSTPSAPTNTPAPNDITVGGSVTDARNNSAIKGALINIVDSTLNQTKNIATDNNGRYSVNNFVRQGDVFSINIASTPAGFNGSPTLNNIPAACNADDTGYQNQDSDTSVINPSCGYNSSPFCGTSCDFSYNAPYTVKYRITEGSAANLNDGGVYTENDFTSNPLTVNYTFKDQTPGIKTLFVRLFFSDGTTLDAQRSINYSPNPTIDQISCTYSPTGTGTQFNVTGSNLGQSQGSSKITINNKNADVGSWAPSTQDPTKTTVVATIPDQVTAATPVQITLGDGRNTNTAQCTINQTTLSFAAKIDCRPGDFSAQNVSVQLYPDAPGVTRPIYPTGTQTFSLDSNGLIQGFSPTLEVGKNYVVVIKAPGTTARAIKFTAVSGTTVLPDIHLPAGNIFPVNQPDSYINSFDVSEMYREWALNGTTGQPADLNKDGAINSLDYACLRNNIGKSDETFTPSVVNPTPGAGGSSGNPTPTGTLTQGANPTPTSAAANPTNPPSPTATTAPNNSIPTPTAAPPPSVGTL